MKIFKLSWLLLIVFLFSSCTFENKNVILNNQSDGNTFYSNSPNSQNELTKQQVETFFQEKLTIQV